MSMGKKIILILLIALGITSPAHALYYLTSTNLEEINHHQAAAATALILGDHTLLEPGNYAISSNVYISGKGTDALYGAWGLSVQAKPWERWGLGLSYGFTDAQLRTRSWLLNAQYSALPGPDSWLQFQTALGHQFLDSSESGNVVFREFDSVWPHPPQNPLILLDDMHWTNLYASVQAQTLLWRFRPQMSLGYVFSYYRWSGYEVDRFGDIESSLDNPFSSSGTTGTVTWTLGLGLDLGPVRPFAGIKVFSGSALFLARLTVIF